MVLTVVIALTVVGAVLVYLFIRTNYFLARVGSFTAQLRLPGDTKWRRGIARYGPRNLAWSPLISWRWQPYLLVSRRALQVVGVPEHDAASDLVVLHLRADTAEYVLALSFANYTGLVSWIDSAPPQEGGR